MKATDIITRAARTLADVQNVRWTIAEHVDYINDGVALIVGANPDVSATTRTIRLTPGARQSIPRGSAAARQVGPGGEELPEGLRYLRAVCNVKQNGATIGRVIRPMDMDVMDRALPDWQVETRSFVDGASVEMAAPDPSDRHAFYVYPAPAASQTVYASITYSTLPAKVVVDQLGEGEPDMELDDSFIGPLVDYVLFRCFAKDGDDTANMSRSSGHFTAFAAAVGLEASGAEA